MGRALCEYGIEAAALRRDGNSQRLAYCEDLSYTSVHGPCF